MDQIILIEQAIFLFVLIIWIVSEIVAWILVIVDVANGKSFDDVIDQAVQERLEYYLSRDEEQEANTNA